MASKKEFCIMPPDDLYATERSGNLHRHEIFFGSNRQKSIKYGLVVFLTPEMHNMSNAGVHFSHEFDLYLKRKGQQAAMDYYQWDIAQFRAVFGKNYL
jgi:hypothetical protein